jgi:hypothetical protein
MLHEQCHSVQPCSLNRQQQQQQALHQNCYTASSLHLMAGHSKHSLNSFGHYIYRQIYVFCFLQPDITCVDMQLLWQLKVCARRTKASGSVITLAIAML